MSRTIKVLGIDPAFANMGFASATVNIDTLEVTAVTLRLVSTASSATKTVRKNSDDLRRARELRGAMLSEASDVDLVMAEIPVGSQSARASWTLGAVLGVLAGCPKPIIELTPAEVKLASVGRKTASKTEMIEWAELHHPDAQWLRRKFKGQSVLTNDNEHLADAVAAIYAGLRTETFALIRSMRLAA